MTCVEDELERAENLLKDRYDRRRGYKEKTLQIAEKRRRKWMV